MEKSRSSLHTFHWPKWVTWSHLSETGCGKSNPTIFLRRENWTCVSSLDDCYTWSKKPSDDKETLRQKTQESKELAGRYWDWGTSSWLFPLFLSLPTSNLSANAIGHTFKLFPELSGAHCLQHWFKPQHPFSVFFFFFLVCWAALPSMWDLSSLTKDWICVPCIGSAEA